MQDSGFKTIPILEAFTALETIIIKNNSNRNPRKNSIRTTLLKNSECKQGATTEDIIKENNPKIKIKGSCEERNVWAGEMT